MKIKTIPVGSFGVNCSVIDNDGAAWIVDPGRDADRIIAAVSGWGLRPGGILLTHAHFDHIGAVPELQRRYAGLPVYLHPADARVLTHPMNQFPPEYPPIERPANLTDAGEAALPGLHVIETPGHTPGGVCYHLPGFNHPDFPGTAGLLLSGDTLFAGSAGRTDLPGGDMATLLRSLRALAGLPGDTLVIPGHGGFTTIADEVRDNVFLR
ncbi:MAG: MBL fold metallo-hydrolase [Kiritimatiellae bacterium]|nr:MBL fold metallo-hydrolase [Kiritimatiellia bacterium]